jgi:hypothetical protein
LHFTLATVFISTEPHIKISVDWVISQVNKYLQTNDFLQGAIFVGRGIDKIDIMDCAREYLKSVGAEWIHILTPNSHQATLIRACLCAIVNEQMCELWRLYIDTNSTLLTA